jgi:uncharacterized protein (TIGR02588 family)
VTFGVSVVVLVLVAGLIARQASEGDRPPEPRVLKTGPAERRGDQYVVPVEVRNEGGGTAESVQVVAELKVGDEVTEADQMVEFLAKGERAELAFVFEEDPGAGELTVRVAGFTVP